MANILKGIDKIVTSDGNTTVDLANIQATGGAGSVNNTDLGISMSETTSAIYYDLNTDTTKRADGHSTSADSVMFMSGLTASNNGQLGNELIAFADGSSSLHTNMPYATYNGVAASNGSQAINGGGRRMDAIYKDMQIVGFSNGSSWNTWGDLSQNLVAPAQGSDGSEAMFMGGNILDGTDFSTNVVEKVSFSDQATRGTHGTLDTAAHNTCSGSNGNVMMMFGGNTKWAAAIFTNKIQRAAFASNSTAQVTGTLGSGSSGRSTGSNASIILALGHDPHTGTQVDSISFDDTAITTSYPTASTALNSHDTSSDGNHLLGKLGTASIRISFDAGSSFSSFGSPSFYGNNGTAASGTAA